MSRAITLLFVLFVGYVTGNLIRSDVTTKDVKIPRDELVNELANELAGGSVAPVEETPAEVYGTDPPKCAKIGEFCTFHGECCTHACLGYLKRCVS